MPTPTGLSEHTPGPLLTFIVPVYNTEPALLDECIRSLLAVSLEEAEREIIVVDDGSDQPVEPQLKGYAASVVCLRQPNGGLSAARNAGMSAAHGRYVQFVDSDDCLLSESYDSCLKLLREQQPDILLFHHTHRQSADTTCRITTATTSGCDYLCTHNLRAAAWGYLWRRDILGTLRFTEGIFHEDEEFTPKLFLQADKLVEVSAAPYFYRERPGSIVRDTNRRKVLKRMVNFRFVIDRLRIECMQSKDRRRQALERRVAQLTMDYLVNLARLTRSYSTMRSETKWLRRRQLFPLPMKGYSWIYAVFSIVTRILFP